MGNDGKNLNGWSIENFQTFMGISKRKTKKDLTQLFSPKKYTKQELKCN